MAVKGDTRTEWYVVIAWAGEQLDYRKCASESDAEKLVARYREHLDVPIAIVRRDITETARPV